MHHEMHQSTIVLVRSVPGSSLLPPPYWKARGPWGRGWQCFPARDTFIQQVIKAWWNVVWQQARKILPGFFFVNEHNNTDMKPQPKKKGFSKLSQKRTSSVWRENMQIIWGKYFVNHSFSGFENKNCVLISTESTVLSRSAKAYSFVAVELSTLKGKSRNITTGADLGGGCRGCAPPLPEMTCGFLIQLVFCKKKNYVVYWCWSRARDECTPS